MLEKDIAKIYWRAKGDKRSALWCTLIQTIDDNGKVVYLEKNGVSPHRHAVPGANTIDKALTHFFSDWCNASAMEPGDEIWVEFVGKEEKEVIL